MRFQDFAAQWRHFDFWLMGAVILLVIFGVTMIRSAVSGNIELSELDLVQRQIIFAVAGFVVIIIVCLIDYRIWSSLSRPMYLIAMALLAALVVLGTALYGSARWFDTGVILIQPSEIAKIVLIMTMADFFTRNMNRLDSIWWVGRSFIYMMGLTIWILLQPNLSTSIVLIVLWASMLWVSGLRMRHLAYFGVAGLVVPFLAWPLMEEYQQNRVLNFLFPDPNARHGDIYNIQQALIAIGSGGFFGQGYGHGTQVQLRFLKVRWSDFIFSSMSQEFGFVGVVLVIAVLLFIIYRILRAAHLAADTFGALLCYGVATMIAFQTIVNIGVNLNLMPATGLTLPFVSYGGSSMLSMLMGIGLVQSVIMRHRSLEF